MASKYRGQVNAESVLKRLRRFAGAATQLDGLYEVRRNVRRASTDFWSGLSSQPNLDSKADRPLLPPDDVGAELWQHPVGQGLFHSGRIQLPDRAPFRYVYDCGKLPSRDWHVHLVPMAIEYGPGPLDALFLSHFDNDHINGLSELLGTFGGAKVVVLPYLSPTRRLLIGMRDMERGPPLDAEHLGLLDNPAGWLFDHGVQQVVFAGAPPNPDDGDGGPIPPNDGPRGDSDGLRMHDSAEPFSWMRLTKAEQLLSFRSPSSSRALRFLDHRQPMVLGSGPSPTGSGAGWVFQTHVDPDPETERAVLVAVRGALGEAACEALLTGAVRCSDFLLHGPSRRRLASAYRTATKLVSPTWKDVLSPLRREGEADRSGMNRTTLSLFSGPLSRRLHRYQRLYSDPAHLDSRLSWSISGMRTRFLRRHVERDGWLLLGDAALADEEVLRRLVGFFGSPSTDYLSRTAVFTVPHHGSDRNLSAETLDRLGPPPIAVVPAGAWTHYEHPRENVMELLRMRCEETIHAHTDSGGLRHLIEI